MRNVYNILSKFSTQGRQFKPINLVRFNAGYLSYDDIPEELPQKFEKCLNEVRLLGRVGSDPIASVRNGKPFVEFLLGTSNYSYDNGGQPDWHRIFTSNPTMIKSLESFVKKGDRLFVAGKLAYTFDENKKVMGVLLFRFIPFS